MSVSIAAKIAVNVTTTETLDASANPGVGAQSITHSAFDVQKTLNGASTPPVDMISEFELAAASGSIDLTALPTLNDPAADATGKKLVILRATNLGANNFSLSIGAANGYAIDGLTVKAYVGGVPTLVPFMDVLADVGPTTKTLDWAISGYTAGDKVRVTMLFG